MRVVFVRGAGGDFSAGARSGLDARWRPTAPRPTIATTPWPWRIMLKHLHDLPALTVALVEGRRLRRRGGPGSRPATWRSPPPTRLRLLEVKLGLSAATISPYVVAAIGPRRARGLFATGRVFDAAMRPPDRPRRRGGRRRRGPRTPRGTASPAEIMACAPGAVAASKAPGRRRRRPADRSRPDERYRPPHRPRPGRRRRAARGSPPSSRRRKPGWAEG